MDQSNLSSSTLSNLPSQIKSKIQKTYKSAIIKTSHSWKKARAARSWKRWVQRYSLQEVALLVFCLGSLYLVNPDFIAFQYLRCTKNAILGAIYSFFMETQLMKVIRG